MVEPAGGREIDTDVLIVGAGPAGLFGVYSGFELFESAPLGPGREEYLDSEKFQYRPRDWQAAAESGENLNLLIGRLNQVRREHLALQQLRDVHFHTAAKEQVVVFSKRAAGTTAGEDDGHRAVVGGGVGQGRRGPFPEVRGRSGPTPRRRSAGSSARRRAGRRRRRA